MRLPAALVLFTATAFAAFAQEAPKPAPDPVPPAAAKPQPLQALRDRPLFSASRRAIAPDAPPTDVAPPDETPEAGGDVPPWTLVGVVLSGRARAALLRPLDGSAPFRLAQGEEKDGWTLVSVGRFAASFRRGDQTATLKFPATLAGGGSGSIPSPDTSPPPVEPVPEPVPEPAPPPPPDSGPAAGSGQQGEAIVGPGAGSRPDLGAGHSAPGASPMSAVPRGLKPNPRPN
jgi:hypothetical protein